MTHECRLRFAGLFFSSPRSPAAASAGRSQPPQSRRWDQRHLQVRLHLTTTSADMTGQFAQPRSHARSPRPARAERRIDRPYQASDRLFVRFALSALPQRQEQAAEMTSHVSAGGCASRTTTKWFEPGASSRGRMAALALPSRRTRGATRMLHPAACMANSTYPAPHSSQGDAPTGGSFRARTLSSGVTTASRSFLAQRASAWCAADEGDAHSTANHQTSNRLGGGEDS